MGAKNLALVVEKFELWKKIWNFKTGATTFLRLTGVRTVLTSGIESFDLNSANPLSRAHIGPGGTGL